MITYSGGLVPGARLGSLSLRRLMASPAVPAGGARGRGWRWRITGPPPDLRPAWPVRALPRGGGFGGLDHLCGQVVVGVGGLESPLAGGAGLFGAVAAGGGPVALVFGGVVQGGQQEFDLVG